MSEQGQPLTEDDTLQQELVAYLDGELDAEAAARVERRLVEDERYRQRLAELDRAWEMLDYLPQTEVDDAFLKSTVEMVAAAAAEDVEKLGRAAARRRAFGWLAAAAALLIAFAAAHFFTARLASRANDRLVRDLPVIENMDVYRHVDSVEFLRKLDREGLFSAEEVDNEL